MAVLQSVKKLYRSLPPRITAPVRLVPDNLLFGKSYRLTNPLTSTSCLGENVKFALEYARAHTLWGKECIPVSPIDACEAEAMLRSLPVVESTELAAHPERFVCDEATELNSYWTTTGGTGRNPTNIRLSNESFGMEWKHIHAIWRMGGYERRHDIKLTFRGYHFKPGELIRYDPIYNELSVDPFQLNKENFSEFLQRVRKYNISCIHGYPSLLAMFMESLKAAGESFCVREIMLGSEGASAELKQEMASFFGAKVVAWYGQTEKVVLAFDAESSGRFINFSSYGTAWVEDPDENGVGEIVGTTFVNRAMPLVNFRTGDYGRIVAEDGRMYIEALQGRWGKDFVYVDSQTRIPTSAINLHGDIQKKIVFYQIVQQEYGKITVKVLPRGGLCEKEEDLRRELEGEIARRLKGVDVRCVVIANESELVRSVRGKLLMLVQNLQL